jgi:amino acid transporter
VLPCIVALCNLGSVMAGTFAHGRMNQELAKEGILPYSHFWASNKPFGAPAPAVSVLPQHVFQLYVHPG